MPFDGFDSTTTFPMSKALIFGFGQALEWLLLGRFNIKLETPCLLHLQPSQESFSCFKTMCLHSILEINY